MYLSSLDIFGFKSFAQRTRINFSPGVTAIVGPNGCGKSNLVDAVRWVLGEQRESTLRSDRMENVIFSGTGKRRPLGMAEISLTLHDTDGRLPVEYEEVTVTRRLFRSGKSEYLLNKNVCRLRDMVDLFVDTGIGPDSYSIIELKMVEDILSGDPEEMRRLLDEAIGITRYKLRRKEALRKLADARQDRERALDILAEVERQTGSLKRQVDRVKSYKRLQEKAHLVRSALVLARVRELESRIKPLSENLGTLKEQIQTRAHELAAAETSLMQVENEILQLEEGRRRFADQFGSTQADHQAILAVQNQTEDRIRSLRWRLETNQEERARIEEERENLTQQMQSAETELRIKESKSPELEAQYREKQNIFLQVDQKYRSVRSAAQKGREDVANLRAQETAAIRDSERRVAQIRSLEERKADLTQRQQDLAERLENRKKEIATILKNLDRGYLQVQGAKEACAESEKKIELLTIQVHQVERDIDQLSAGAAQIQFQIEHLQELHRRGTPLYAAGGSLAAKYPELIGAALSDELAVEEGYQQPVESALMGMVYARVVENAAELSALRDFARAKGAGRAALLLGNPPSLENESAKAYASKWGSRALAEVILGDSPAANWLRFLLGKVVLVNSQDDLLRLSEQARQKGLALVTGEGEFTDGGGLWIIGGSGEEPPRVKHLSSRMRELQQQQQENRARRQRLETGISRIRENLKAEEIKLQQANDALIQKEQRLESQQREKLQSEAQMVSASLMLEQMRQEATEVTSKLTEIAVSEIAPEAIPPSLDERLHSLLADQQAREQQETKILEERELARQNLERGQLDFERLKAELERLHDRFAAEQRREQELFQRRTILGEEDQRIEGEVTRLQGELELQLTRSAEVGAVLTGLRQHLDDFDTNRRELQETQRIQNVRVREYRVQIEQVSSQLHQSELQSVEFEAALREERGKLEGLDLDRIAEEKADAVILAKLDRKIFSLEPLNLAAEGEYLEQMSRLNFYQEQLKDLEQAEADLQRTVTTLNQEARERFETGFGRIRENLRRIFQDVFKGGEVDIKLAGEDLLEDRIEIMAAPPGKRLGSLTLLSGGEKALTAISLLFAIYLEKPSPFCILDEVDAPLDDENTLRFCNMLQNFTTKTQFLVVTHNKRTMAEAQQLLGITMEEEGISKVVPVKLN